MKDQRRGTPPPTPERRGTPPPTPEGGQRQGDTPHQPVGDLAELLEHAEMVRQAMEAGTWSRRYRSSSGPSGGQDRYRKFTPEGKANPRYRGGNRHRPKFERAAFVAIDGEGRNHPERLEEHLRILPVGPARKRVPQPIQVGVRDHDFVLLSTSTCLRIRAEDGERLTTAECLRFLIQAAQNHPGAYFIGYSLTYDIEQMLRDLPRRELQTLWGGKKVFHDSYVIEYLPRHHLWVRDLDYRRTRSYRPVSVTIYDAIGFFQQSFVQTLQQWYPDCPDLELIKQGKAVRGSFSELNDAAFEERYNDAENKALVMVMERFREALKQAGISVRRWDGAGTIATALMKREGVRAHMTRTRRQVGVDERGQPRYVDRDDIPEGVREAALHAQFGGRIEAPIVGNHRGTCWAFDLNSAYPWALPDLPSLRGGKWILHRGQPSELTAFALYLVDWLFLDGPPFYPLPFRTDLGTILYPKQGRGWFWGPEVIAALKHHPRGIRIEKWYELRPASAVPPFAFVEPVAARRLSLKRRPRDDSQWAANIPLKLGLNSIPGKQAQQRGVRLDEAGNLIRIPPHYQPEWAGYVTAKTRAAVYDVAMQDPDAIISFNTDGIYSLRPLQVELGENLGQWEQKQLEWFVSVQSGVYFYGEPGELEPVEHYRGFDRGSLSPERIITAWQAGQPVLEAELTRLVTLGQALHHRGNEAEFRRYFGSWRRAPRLLRLDQAFGKRTHLGGRELRQAATSLIRTRPRSLPVSEMSARIPLKWDPRTALLDEPEEEYDGTLLSAVLADYTS